MSNRPDKTGFTLVELLVALAIIVTIVTMVYGSYSATSKSAQVCSARMAIFQQGSKILEQMAQQVRCSYADAAQMFANMAAAVSPKKEAKPENIINYFHGDSDDPRGEILRMVTTHGIFSGQQEDSLFDVTYRFDKGTATLSVSQIRFVNTVNLTERRNWRPLAENVESVELAFFDGQQWLPKWDFGQKRKLPCAVRISITCEDENYRQYCYGTVANVCCQSSQDVNSPSGTLAAVGKQ
jgi:type II secretion system protein J